MHSSAYKHANPFSEGVRDRKLKPLQLSVPSGSYMQLKCLNEQEKHAGIRIQFPNVFLVIQSDLELHELQKKGQTNKKTKPSPTIFINSTVKLYRPKLFTQNVST